MTCNDLIWFDSFVCSYLSFSSHQKFLWLIFCFVRFDSHVNNFFSIHDDFWNEIWQQKVSFLNCLWIKNLLLFLFLWYDCDCFFHFVFHVLFIFILTNIMIKIFQLTINTNSFLFLSVYLCIASYLIIHSFNPFFLHVNQSKNRKKNQKSKIKKKDWKSNKKTNNHHPLDDPYSIYLSIIYTNPQSISIHNVNSILFRTVC